LRKVKMLFLIRVLILILPTFISNIVYDIVAYTRYKFFGKYDSCPVLKDDLKSRVIE
jgi:predicted DCC family thiol-disulfide oxidoreductase YuxK